MIDSAGSLPQHTMNSFTVAAGAFLLANAAVASTELRQPAAGKKPHIIMHLAVSLYQNESYSFANCLCAKKIYTCCPSAPNVICLAKFLCCTQDDFGWANGKRWAESNPLFLS